MFVCLSLLICNQSSLAFLAFSFKPEYLEMNSSADSEDIDLKAIHFEWKAPGQTSFMEEEEAWTRSLFIIICPAILHYSQ